MRRSRRRPSVVSRRQGTPRRQGIPRRAAGASAILDFAPMRQRRPSGTRPHGSPRQYPPFVRPTAAQRSLQRDRSARHASEFRPVCSSLLIVSTSSSPLEAVCTLHIRISVTVTNRALTRPRLQIKKKGGPSQNLLERATFTAPAIRESRCTSSRPSVRGWSMSAQSSRNQIRSIPSCPEGGCRTSWCPSLGSTCRG